MNRRLSHKQDQHASALGEKVRQVEELETALIKARVQISEQPLQAVDRQRAETKVTLLQARVLQLEEDKKRLEEQLQLDWDRRKKALAQLETAQGLVGMHLENATKNRHEADKYRHQCQDLIDQCNHVTDQLNHTKQELGQEQQEHSRTREQWRGEKLQLEESVAAKTESLDVLLKEKVLLQEEITQVSEDRDRLDAALKQAKKKLEVPRADECLQAGCSLDHLFEACVQVRTETLGTFTQTEPPPTVHTMSSQTVDRRAVTAACQTSQQEWTISHGTQTSSPHLVHVGSGPSLSDSGQSVRHTAVQTNLQSSASMPVNFASANSCQLKGEQTRPRHDSMHSNVSVREDGQTNLTSFTDTGINSIQLHSDFAVGGKGETSKWLPHSCNRKLSVSSTTGSQNTFESNQGSSPLFYRFGASNCSTPHIPVDAMKSKESIWQQMSSAREELPEGNADKTVKETLSPQTQQIDPCKNSYSDLDAPVKQEIMEENDEGPARTKNSLSKQMRGATERCPKYPHLLYGESEVCEADVGQLYLPSKDQDSELNRHELIEDRTSNQKEVLNTNTNLYQVKIPDLKESYKEENYNSTTLKLKDKSHAHYSHSTNQVDLSLTSVNESSIHRFNSTNPASVESTPNLIPSSGIKSELGHEHLSSNKASDPPLRVNKSISSSSDRSDQYGCGFISNSHSRAAGRDVLSSKDGNVQVETIEQPKVSPEDAYQKLPKTRKVFGNLSLSRITADTAKNDTLTLPVSNNRPELRVTVLKNTTSAGKDLNDKGISLFSGKNHAGQYLHNQHNQKQQKILPKANKKNAPLLKYFGGIGPEIENASDVENKSKELCHDKEIRETKFKTDESSAANITSPTNSTSRTIFKSSHSRPSLQETISAFSASRKSRLLQGGPPSKSSSQRSKAVAKVTPLGQGLRDDKTKPPKHRAEPNNPRLESRSSPTHGKSQVGQRQNKVWSPLFPANISKMCGYSLGESNTWTRPDALPKGILKAPETTAASFVSAKSVHFPAQLEIHMKGLTQESQESQMMSPPATRQPVSTVSEMFQDEGPSPTQPRQTVQVSSTEYCDKQAVSNGSALPTNAGANLFMSAACMGKVHSETSKPLPRDSEDGTVLSSSAINKNRTESAGETLCCISHTDKNFARGLSHGSKDTEKNSLPSGVANFQGQKMCELPLPNSQCQEQPKEYETHFKGSTSTAEKNLIWAKRCGSSTGTTQVNVNSVLSGAEEIRVGNSHLLRVVGSCSSVAPKRPDNDVCSGLVIPETPNLSAVAELSPHPEAVPDWSTVQEGSNDQASLHPPDCKKPKLCSPQT